MNFVKGTANYNNVKTVYALCYFIFMYLISLQQNCIPAKYICYTADSYMSIIISYTVQPPPRCRFGKTFQTCARCFRTCKNPYRSLCTRRCRRGCFCPSGRVTHRGRCILPRQCRGSEWNLTCIANKVQYIRTLKQCMHYAVSFPCA